MSDLSRILMYIKYNEFCSDVRVSYSMVYVVITVTTNTNSGMRQLYKTNIENDSKCCTIYTVFSIFLQVSSCKKRLFETDKCRTKKKKRGFRHRTHYQVKCSKLFLNMMCVERNMQRAHFHSQISHENSFIYLTKKITFLVSDIFQRPFVKFKILLSMSTKFS